MSMPFRTPTLNLVCNIWHAQVFPPGRPPDLSPPCQLRLLKTAAVQSVNFGAGMEIALALAALTDVRADTFHGALDLCECPAGSGRFYIVVGVEDVAKGFANEYRLAVIQQDHSAAGSWPYPTP
jgi:hypothetical protein